ncbi:terminase [Brenneria roseae subsp. americana]|uniref:Terminase n=1 Tax=Brenneria roseae subsp. americana TaxID=1508507 RepID=A0A2U1TNE5_9GAMM|nr:phage terminase small subunit [Brenneria roseae]PWC10927.1 terminase [Brenneria roseae subsp. americana]
MLTPAQKHFQRVMAERHGNAETQTDTARTAHEQIMHRLRMDQSALRKVQSDQAKAAMKQRLLPHYEGWIEGTIEGDSGRQDEVIVTLMVWAIDAANYPLAVRIGRYVVTHGLVMPDRFNRTAPTVLVEEICDPILVQVKADDSADISTNLAVLDEVAQIVDGKDMPDQVRAKLFKTRAFALRNGTETQATALEYLREALKLDAGAGVKKEIERLARLVKKNSQSADAEAGSDAGNAADGGEDTTESATNDASAEASSDSAVVATATSKTSARKTTRKTASTVRKTTTRKAAAKKAAPEKTE